MFKLRERDGLPQPYRCPKPSDWHQFFTCKLQSGNSKETFAKFVARTHRERSAQRDAITVPRHRSYTPFKICRACRVVCPGKKSGSSASRPRRPRARCERSPRERWVLSRHAASFFSWREPVAAHTSERSPGARESGKKRTKVTRNAPRRIPRSSAPRRATRSSRASSKKTRRTRGRTSTTSQRRFAPVP